jgi:hypothetical protein
VTESPAAKIIFRTLSNTSNPDRMVVSPSEWELVRLGGAVLAVIHALRDKNVRAVQIDHLMAEATFLKQMNHLTEAQSRYTKFSRRGNESWLIKK